MTTSAEPAPPEARQLLCALCALPEALLSLILRHLPSPRSVAAMVSTCRSFQVLATADTGVWEPHTAEKRWRLRRRDDENDYEACRRILLAKRRQRIMLIGGADIYDASVNCVDSFDIRSGTWRECVVGPPRLSLCTPLSAPACLRSGRRPCPALEMRQQQPAMPTRSSCSAAGMETSTRR